MFSKKILVAEIECRFPNSLGTREKERELANEELTEQKEVAHWSCELAQMTIRSKSQVVLNITCQKGSNATRIASKLSLVLSTTSWMSIEHVGHLKRKIEVHVVFSM